MENENVFIVEIAITKTLIMAVVAARRSAKFILVGILLCRTHTHAQVIKVFRSKYQNPIFMNVK